MRAFVMFMAALAIPTVGHSQDNGPVGGRVGSDLSTSPTHLATLSIHGHEFVGSAQLMSSNVATHPLIQ